MFSNLIFVENTGGKEFKASSTISIFGDKVYVSRSYQRKYTDKQFSIQFIHFSAKTAILVKASYTPMQRQQPLTNPQGFIPICQRVRKASQEFRSYSQEFRQALQQI